MNDRSKTLSYLGGRLRCSLGRRFQSEGEQFVTQKVHWTTKDKYSQSPLVLDEATGLAWLYDLAGNIIPPSLELKIHAGPIAIRKRIYQAAIDAGYNVEAY
jgi:hypothetical protein